MAIISNNQAIFKDKIRNQAIFKGEIRIVDNFTTNIENIYDYSFYEYYGMSVSFLDRENHIMYPYVYDNYINVMKKIAKEIDDIIMCEKIDIGLLLINNKNVRIYMYFKKAKTPLIRFMNKGYTIMNDRLVDKLTSLNEQNGLQLHASVKNYQRENLFVSSLSDWELIE